MNDVVDSTLSGYLIQAGFVQRLALIARQITEYSPLMVPITTIITRINSSEHQDTVHCVECGFVQIFFSWLSIKDLKKGVVKEILFCMSNFTIDSSEVCSFVLDDQERFSTLVRLCYHEDERVRSEAVWNFCNATAVCNREKITLLV